MIVINQIVLHTFNINSNGLRLSNETLLLNDTLNKFFLKHIQAAFANQRAKHGIFYEDSACAAILQKLLSDEISFISMSQQIAHKYFDTIKQSATANTINLFFCDFLAEEIPYLGIFKYTAQPALVACTDSSDAIIKNEINLQEIIPSSSSRLEEFAFISKTNLQILVSGIKYNIDGNNIFLLPEAILECSTAPSPQETIQTMQKVAEKVATEYGANDTNTNAAVKKAIANELDEYAELTPSAASKEIFPDSPDMQQAYEKEIIACGYSDSQSIPVDKEKTLRKVLHQKLKTDTGIELTIPVDYFENADYVEFIHAEDGSISITLKKINNIMNRP